MSCCDFFTNLGISVLGSTIPVVIVFVWGYFKWWIPHSELKKSGVVKVHKNQEAAEPIILEAIKSSKNLRVLSVKGETFSDNSKDIGNYVLNTGTVKQKYLISDTKEKNKYIEKREKELELLRCNPLSEALETSYKYFLEAQKKHPTTIEIKRHCETLRFRIILLDDYLFLSFQQKDKLGKDCQMLQIKENSTMYKTYMDYFEDLWEDY